MNYWTNCFSARYSRASSMLRGVRRLVGDSLALGGSQDGVDARTEAGVGWRCAGRFPAFLLDNAGFPVLFRVCGGGILHHFLCTSL
jgi:hypothetical protein